MNKRILWVKDGFESFDDKEEDDDETFTESDQHPVIPIINTSDMMLESFKDINYWIGHTNFRLNARHVNKVSDVPGIEIVTVPTEYRLIIAVAKLFDDKEVRNAIDTLFCGSTPTIEEIPDKIKEEIKRLSNSKAWFLYVLPNGSYVYDRIEDCKVEEEYYEALSNAKRDYDELGGNFYGDESA